MTKRTTHSIINWTVSDHICSRHAPLSLCKDASSIIQHFPTIREPPSQISSLDQRTDLLRASLMHTVRLIHDDAVLASSLRTPPHVLRARQPSSPSPAATAAAANTRSRDRGNSNAANSFVIGDSNLDGLQGCIAVRVPKQCIDVVLMRFRVKVDVMLAFNAISLCCCYAGHERAAKWPVRGEKSCALGCASFAKRRVVFAKRKRINLLIQSPVGTIDARLISDDRCAAYLGGTEIAPKTSDRK